MKGGKYLPRFSQIQQFPRILSSLEKRLFTAGVALFILGSVFLLIGGFSHFFVTVPQRGGTLTEGMLGYPQLINPLYADANTVDRELTSLIYSGLLIYNPTSDALEPHLAESWSLSEDEKMYTFTLRQDVTWHDGEPFSAYDVIFTYSALQNAAYGSPLFDAYQNIIISQVDDRTLTFTLAEPYAAFPELLTVGILPAHLWEEIAPANARLVALNLKPVGTGPYLLEKTSKDSRGIIRSITLQTFDEYLGIRPYLDEIIVKFFSNTTDIMQALQTKRIDATATLSLTEALTLQDDNALRITPLPLSQYVGAFFNTQKDPLNSLEIRKALTLSLDIPAITADATGNLGQPTGFALPGFPATGASVQDTQTASLLLEEAGWVLNEHGKRTQENRELTLTITTAERPELLRAAEKVAENWRSLGITVNISPLSHANIATALQEKTYDVLLAAEQYGIIADPYPFWHSTGKNAGGLNMSLFSTSAADTAVSTLRTSANTEKRQEAFNTLNQELLEHMPVVFLFQNALPLVHTVDIMGITPDAIPHTSARWLLESSWYRRTGLSWKF